MHALFAVVFRLLALVGKELTETIRRPGALASLVLGPFLIMAIFGIGYTGVKRPLETIVVTAPIEGLPTDKAGFQTLAGGGLHIADVTTDRSAATASLASGAVDLLIVVPTDPWAAFRAGRQSVIEVLVDTVDPFEAGYANALSGALASEVNRAIIERAAAEGEGYAIENGANAATVIPPEVVAAPTRAALTNVAPTVPAVTAFFGPAVLALILQHLAITLVALSLIRERTTGILELFRIAPISTTELLAGKILAFGIIGAGIAALTIALLIGAFAVPALAPAGSIALAVGLLLLASLGVGTLIAVISDSERQVVQLSLLVLLASVFFSGFVLSVDQFSPFAQAVAFVLPVTHGIELLQAMLLRGVAPSPSPYVALAVIALVTLLPSWALLRRSMTRA